MIKTLNGLPRVDEQVITKYYTFKGSDFTTETGSIIGYSGNKITEYCITKTYKDIFDEENVAIIKEIRINKEKSLEYAKRLEYDKSNNSPYSNNIYENTKHYLNNARITTSIVKDIISSGMMSLVPKENLYSITDGKVSRVGGDNELFSETAYILALSEPIPSNVEIELVVDYVY